MSLASATPSEMPHQLERMSSHPSLTHSSSSTTSDEVDQPRLLAPNSHSQTLQGRQVRDAKSALARHSESLLTPTTIAIDVRVHSGSDHEHSDEHEHEHEREHEIEGLRREAEEARKSFRGLNLSRSMQSLKGKKEKMDKERQRSALGRERAVTLTSSPSSSLPNLVPGSPIPMPNKVESKVPSSKIKSSGGFSSFIRKLTGKSKEKEKSSPPATAPVAASRHSTTPGQARSSRPARPIIETRPAAPPTSESRKAVQPRIITPASSSRLSQDLVLSPVVLSTPPRETDPCKIPLPPSPASEREELRPLSTSVPVVVDVAPVSASSTTSGPSLKRVKQTRMLSLEGFEFEDELVEEDEVADMVRPLRPIRIPSLRGNSSAPGSISPGLRSASTTDEATLLTPTSAKSYSPATREDTRLAGSSPPRKAPIGTGVGLHRKESKWRKSVMNLSDSLNGSIHRRTSTKPPPTSFDAYQAHQRRLAANRASCAPTLHSAASIAADIREIKDKEQVDMAETFFLS